MDPPSGNRVPDVALNSSNKGVGRNGRLRRLVFQPQPSVLFGGLDEYAVPNRGRGGFQIGTPPRHDQRRGEEGRSADWSCRLLPPDVFSGREIPCAIAFKPGTILLAVAHLSRLGGRSFADQLKDGGRLVLALYLDPVELAKHETGGDRRCRSRSDDDAAAVILGHAFEARGDVHGLADRGIVVPLWRADIADHGWARIDADLHRIARHALHIGLGLRLHYLLYDA